MMYSQPAGTRNSASNAFGSFRFARAAAIGLSVVSVGCEQSKPIGDSGDSLSASRLVLPAHPSPEECYLTTPGWETLLGPDASPIEMTSPTKIRLKYSAHSASSDRVTWNTVEVPGRDESSKRWEYQLEVIPSTLREDFVNGKLKCQLLLWNKCGEKKVVSPVATGDPNGLLFGLPDDFTVHTIAVEYLSFESAFAIRRSALNRAQSMGLDLLPEMVLGTSPAFTVTTISGQRVSSTDLKGKVIVIDQGFLRCHACMHVALPELKELAQRYKNKLAVVYVVHDKDPELKEMTRRLGEYATQWHIVQVAPGSELSSLWFQAGLGTTTGAMPFVTVIGPDGVVKDSWQGGAEGHLRSTILKILPEGDL